ncbi:MAG: hypothetical protein IJ042_09935, partial [Butyricicoccus sp.]|nr:hypothetical protein [Butyricicoccus sp.]
SPDGGSSGASFLFRPACFHAFLPIPVLGFLHFRSPYAVSPHSGYLSAPAFFLSASGLFPLAFATGSGYLALGKYTISCVFLSAPYLSFRSRLAYIITYISVCQHLFSIFLKNFFETVFGGASARAADGCRLLLLHGACRGGNRNPFLLIPTFFVCFSADLEDFLRITETIVEKSHFTS